jgi:hypothetical protein
MSGLQCSAHRIDSRRYVAGAHWTALSPVGSWGAGSPRLAYGRRCRFFALDSDSQPLQCPYDMGGSLEGDVFIGVGWGTVLRWWFAGVGLLSQGPLPRPVLPGCPPAAAPASGALLV